MQANKRNRISFVRACSLVTIASVCLLLVVGMSINSLISAQPEDTSTGTSSSHSTRNPKDPLPGSLTFLNVITEVDNANGGTKKPSDFTITVSGNNPSPKSFPGSSSGTPVTLRSGSYKVTEDNSITGYSTSYSSGCSGDASGGVPIKCTISNQYQTNPAPPTPSPTPKKTSSITIISNSNSVYSIPSTFVKVDRFTTNYTIAGEISSIDASKDLITSTIVNDFDRNPNIGYVVNSSSSSLNKSSRPGLPNPFVSNDTTINQKITNEVQVAIAASAAANPTGKYTEIKCSFGMILDKYKCS
jgi:Prealbumin-like fold domain